MDLNEALGTVLNPLSLFISEVILFLPKVIAAYIIWLIGKWLIDWVSTNINRLDIKGWTFDDRIRGVIRTAFNYTAKFVLILIILDTFGIGSSIVAALVNGLTFTIAIALGLSLGRALEPEAQRFVDSMRRYTQDKITRA